MKKQLLDVLAWTIILLASISLIGLISYIFYEYIGFDGMLSLWAVGVIGACLIWAFSRVSNN